MVPVSRKTRKPELVSARQKVTCLFAAFNREIVSREEAFNSSQGGWPHLRRDRQVL